MARYGSTREDVALCLLHRDLGGLRCSLDVVHDDVALITMALVRLTASHNRDAWVLTFLRSCDCRYAMKSHQTRTGTIQCHVLHRPRRCATLLEQAQSPCTRVTVMTPFEYARDVTQINFRTSKLYQVGRGEQGVLLVRALQVRAPAYDRLPR